MNEFLYGKLNKEVEKVEYVGVDTETAKTTVNTDPTYKDNKIKVDVITHTTPVREEGLVPGYTDRGTLQTEDGIDSKDTTNKGQLDKTASDLRELMAEELAKKVDKKSNPDGTWVYGNSDEEEVAIEATTDNDANTLAFRDSAGNIKVGTPSDNSDAAPKNYVDESISSEAELRETADDDIIQRIQNLEGQTIRLLYTDTLPDDPDEAAAAIQQFVIDSGYSDVTKWPSIAVVISGTYHIWHCYEQDTLINSFVGGGTLSTICDTINDYIETLKNGDGLPELCKFVINIPNWNITATDPMTTPTILVSFTYQSSEEQILLCRFEYEEDRSSWVLIANAAFSDFYKQIADIQLFAPEDLATDDSVSALTKVDMFSYNREWKDDGVDTVSVFTNSSPGIIRGSTASGYVSAQGDGTGKVSGFDNKLDKKLFSNNPQTWTNVGDFIADDPPSANKHRILAGLYCVDEAGDQVIIPFSLAGGARVDGEPEGSPTDPNGTPLGIPTPVVYNSANQVLCCKATDAKHTVPLGQLRDYLTRKTTYCTFNTTSANTTITLQNLTGKLFIDWGDGTVNTSLTHTYETAGTYTCSIYGVTTIGYRAFMNNTYLTGIMISDNVTIIDTEAFRYCSNLTNATIGNGVTRINSSAFRQSGLTNIVIPDSVSIIAINAFQSCSSLKSVTIGSGVTSIAQYVFAGCSTLQQIVFEGLTPPSLTDSTPLEQTNNCPIYVPRVALTTYKQTTYFSTHSARIVANASTKDLDTKQDTLTFDNTPTAGSNNPVKSGGIKTALDGKQNIEPSLILTLTTTSASQSVGFPYLSGITSIDWGDGTVNTNNSHIYTTIGTYICKVYGATVISGYNGGMSGQYPCVSPLSCVKKIIIGSPVTEITDNAFYEFGNTSILDVTIGSNVASISNYAFSYCTGLQKIVVESIIPPTLTYDVFNSTNNCPIYVPKQSLQAYKTATNWSSYASRIFTDATTKDLEALTGSSDPTTSTVGYVGQFYFNTTDDTTWQCKEVSGSTYTWEKSGAAVDDTLSFTSENPVQNKVLAKKLEDCLTFKITTTSTNQTVTLSNLTGLTYVDWGDGTSNNTTSHSYTTTGNYVCRAYGVTAIADGNAACISPADVLKDVVIGKNTTSIGNLAFFNCSNLKNVTIENGVTFIGTSAFHNCYTLATIIIPNSVTTLGNTTFCSCSSLISIIIPNSIKYIPAQIFLNCSKLESVIISSNAVTNIGLSAFQGCVKLLEIVLESLTPPTLGSNVFQDTNNCLIYVPLSALNDYKTSANWTTYADRIVANATTKDLEALTGSSDPTTSTVGYLGQFYFNTTDDTVFQCKDISGSTYTWEKQGSNTGPEEQPNLTLTIKTTSANTNITLRSLTNKTSIDWGDGTTDSNLSHTYATAGTYVCKIYGVTAIGGASSSYSVFSDGASLLTAVVIGSVFTNIGGYAFYNCTGLKDVQINADLTSIGDYAFWKTQSLHYITLPDTINTLGQHVFEYSGLYSITLPNNLWAAPAYGFAHTPLRHVDLYCPNMGQINGYAFQSCTALESVEIPTNCIVLNGYVFQDCTRLSTVIFRCHSNAGNVRSLLNGNNFKGCTDLAYVVIEDTQVFGTISASNFDNTNSRLRIYVRDSLLEGFKAKVPTIASKIYSNVTQPQLNTSDPTTSTVAQYLGQLYINTSTNKTFVCTAINNSTYSWIEVGGSKWTAVNDTLYIFVLDTLMATQMNVLFHDTTNIFQTSTIIIPPTTSYLEIQGTKSSQDLYVNAQIIETQDPDLGTYWTVTVYAPSGCTIDGYFTI